ncbi:hypothetical protein BGW36DRAFT_359198 [Talaromyces proteolyticus]|uniref:Uncharacterized protein n=1 Tax=Talaromyces proteolyticus TaxID=1131652 RepID=A0AAD4KUQ6_9EURO|nr:uncharacterized protein BGW36DRAFT_359198 [Talaromyces proteolyticus]KAH8697405.1 hypothetical protein BGW36DRAFT_359198 [Talaromyces proteolyticus]
MRYSICLLVSLACLAVSSPSSSPRPAPATFGSDVDCPYPNGNCYDDDCHGELSVDRVTCTEGADKGCGCGYKCGAVSGKCSDNECNGVKGRCTYNYLGCTCVL